MDEGEKVIKPKKLGRDPNVNTEFLKSEEKKIEEEIKRKAELNKVFIDYFKLTLGTQT